MIKRDKNNNIVYSALTQQERTELTTNHEIVYCIETQHFILEPLNPQYD